MEYTRSIKLAGGQRFLSHGFSVTVTEADLPGDGPKRHIDLVLFAEAYVFKAASSAGVLFPDERQAWLQAIQNLRSGSQAT
jgi:hypothetical protein